MAISSTAAVGARPASQTGSIGIEDFLKILTSQLNNQDPLKPLENHEFVAQIAQFANLDQSRQMNEKLDSLLSFQSTMQSVGMLGRTVDINQRGGMVSGRVTALDVSSGTPLMTVSTANGTFLDRISLSQVINIR
ncbi:MAG TPA: flagellar hook capping FlgD N-terminal domain-containing protein [Pseudoduganella sp.]